MRTPFDRLSKFVKKLTGDAPITTREALGDQETWPSLLSAFGKSVASILADRDPEVPTLLSQSVSEFTTIARKYEPESEAEEEKFTSALAALDSVVMDISKSETVITKPTLAILSKALDSLYGLAVIARKDGTTKGDGTMKKTADQILASLPAEDQEVLKSQMKATPDEVKKRIDDLEARALKAEEVAKAEKDARLLREATERAVKLAPPGVKAEDLGPILKTLGEKAPDEAKKVEEFLATAAKSAQAQQKLFEEIGKTGTAEDIEAVTLINKAADDLRTADPKLTREQAIAKALENNPSLYNEYNKGRKGVQ